MYSRVMIKITDSFITLQKQKQQKQLQMSFQQSYQADTDCRSRHFVVKQTGIIDPSDCLWPAAVGPDLILKSKAQIGRKV